MCSLICGLDCERRDVMAITATNEEITNLAVKEGKI